MFKITESGNIATVKGLFMKAGLSLNMAKYTENAVKDMVEQINRHAEQVKNGVKGQQYITMNYSHFTDETMGTVGRIVSATYEPKEDGGEAYFTAEIFTDTEQGQFVLKLIKENALNHVSIYGYVDDPDDIEMHQDKDGNFDYQIVHKLTLARVDFTKTPGVQAAYVVQASKNHKYVIGSEEILKSKHLLGGIMEEKTKVKTAVLEEELNKKKEELKETKAQLADLQKKVEDLTEALKQEKEILKQAYSKLDEYMLETYLEEIKATKDLPEKVIGIIGESIKKEDFQSKELDAEKRYVEFKEFCKPIVESVETIVKSIQEEIKDKDEIKEEKEDKNEPVKDTDTVSDIISNLL